ELNDLKASGEKITVCSACGFEANQDSELFPGMTRSRCLVCRRDDRSYQFPCPKDKCQGEIVVSDGGGGQCLECEEYLAIDDILNQFQRNIKPGEPDDYSQAYCSECESYEAIGGSVVFVDDADRYICFSCLQDYEVNEVASCEWCGEPITGNSDESWLMGCMNCDGRMGHFKDD
ncbi:MAG: hypothetical protein ACWA5W_09795, partial [Phycisphaerales bacterium]